MMAADQESWRVGVDTGGTFTDLVAVGPGGELRRVKVSSTPEEPAAATFTGLKRTSLDLARDVDSFVIGTTIATNALIQRAGSDTVFVTTKGFEDTLYIQRVDRKGLYDLQWVKSEPYVGRQRTVGVRERILSDGSVSVLLEPAEIDRVLKQIQEMIDQAEQPAIAVSLLFSYVNDAHERELASALRERFPEVSISISSEVAPTWREYERGNTTVVDSYVKPTVAKFVDSLNTGLQNEGITGWRALMRSNGGQVPIDQAGDRPVEMILSGLASGMIAGSYYAAASGSQKAVTLDMGGTSADVGVIVDGELRFSGLFEIEFGLPISLPVLDVTTIGAGGGSIASIDSGGLLRVGPESAGAEPGPACYGMGGHLPTITDANLVLGRLNPDYFLGGEVKLDVQLAEKALGTLTEPLGLTLDGVADAILSVGIENMTSAVRLVTVDRGLDYRDFDLVAFGGAGPLHAAEIARRMRMRRVIVPPSPGLVSAFGAVIADQRIDRRVTLVRRLDRTAAVDVPVRLASLANDIEEELRGQLRVEDAEIVVSTYVACRYQGQNYEQEVRTEFGHFDHSFELVSEIDPQISDFIRRLMDEYHSMHREAYGYEMLDQPIESVYLGASAAVAAPVLDLLPYSPDEADAEVQDRSVFVDANNRGDIPVHRRDNLRVGEQMAGPILIEETDSTTWVPEGFGMTVDTNQSLIIAEDR